MKEQTFSEVSRRRFLKIAGVAAVALPALPFGLAAFRDSALTSERAGAADGPPNLSWETTMVQPNEPGDPLIISGRIYGPDGVTPAKGITLYVYHTDARGYYSVEGANGQQGTPRLRGWMRTNDDGKYEFRTIKAAPYPNGGPPAHIHVAVSGPGYPEYWIDNYLFEGDPRITASHRASLSGLGRFSSIIALKANGQGVLSGVRDIKLKSV